ncbi:hypothetical protein KXV55_004804 [Aspergillus fumigatus]|nr:hypothetical protein KXW10_007908 [Aspergillus fumigatus]KAH3504652.1 hypothetical protein KXV55_004804 [Aspergillus fumigatus]
MAADPWTPRQGERSDDRSDGATANSTETPPFGGRSQNPGDSKHPVGTRLASKPAWAGSIRADAESNEAGPENTQGLPRALSTVIIQMRTGKIRLRHYLYEQGVPDIQDGDCRVRRATQTVRHVLLACPLFKDLC